MPLVGFAPTVDTESEGAAWMRSHRPNTGDVSGEALP
jgi:hypothetical protein